MKIVRLITFESFLKINDYFSGLFMHRFKHCKNLPEYFDSYFI